MRTEVASTTVYFADLDDEEIEAYVRTGEPLQVAGAFTLDGLGGAYVTRIEGDSSNVVGISLPLLRTMLADAGIAWRDLLAGGTVRGSTKQAPDGQNHQHRIECDDDSDHQPAEGSCGRPGRVPTASAPGPR